MQSKKKQVEKLRYLTRFFVVLLIIMSLGLITSCSSEINDNLLGNAKLQTTKIFSESKTSSQKTTPANIITDWIDPKHIDKNKLQKYLEENSHKQLNDGLNKLLQEKNNDSKPEFAPKELIIRLNDDIISMPKDSEGFISVNKATVKSFELQNLIEKYSVNKIMEFKSTTNKDFRFYTLRYDSDFVVPSVVEEFNTLANVMYAEPNYIYDFMFVPNDPLYQEQDHHQFINSELAWDIEQGNEDVVIAIIDTGVDLDHPDIEDNLVEGFDTVDINLDEYLNRGYFRVHAEDYMEFDNEPNDLYGHGTHVAGIAGATTNNGIGVAGVCPMCSIMPVKIGFIMTNRRADRIYTFIEQDDAAMGIIMAADNDADIISMSWGSFRESQLITDAVNHAHQQGALLIAAAGNVRVTDPDWFTSPKTLGYPAASEHVVSVGANEGELNRRAWWSNCGETVDISAPGTNILSLRAEGTNMNENDNFIVQEEYYIASGTSMAAPIVAGVAGLLKSRNAAWNNDMITEQLIGSAAQFSRQYDPVRAIPINFDMYDFFRFGSGSVDSLRALTIQPQPRITLEGFELHDVDGNMNEYINPEETVELFVSLKNWWGAADGVERFTATLSTDNENIEFIRDTIEFENIPLLGGIVINDLPFTFTADEELDPPEHIFFTLEVETRDVVNQLSFPFELRFMVQRPDIPAHHPPTKQGWPMDTQFSIYASPTIADINNDRSNDIIVPTGSNSLIYDIGGKPYPFEGIMKNIHALNSNGENVNGWPVPISSNYGNAISVADVDNNGNLEISTCSWENETSWWFDFQARGDNLIQLWNHNGQSMNNWPIDIESIDELYPRLFDLNDDNSAEIVIPSGEQGIEVFSQAGNLMDNWPQVQDAYGPVMIGNLDDDADMELIYKGRGFITAYNIDGSVVEGWPFQLEEDWFAYGNPVLADLNNDGVDEVIVSAYLWGQMGVLARSIIILTSDGEILENWDINNEVYITLANIDEDDEPEIVGIDSSDSDRPSIYVWNSDGSEVEGFPQEIPWLYDDERQIPWFHNDRDDYVLVNRHPIISDIDGDNRNEIMISLLNRGYLDKQEVTYIVAFEHDGELKEDEFWPIVPDTDVRIRSYSAALAIDDLDNDDNVELIFAASRYCDELNLLLYGCGRLYVYELGVPPKQFKDDWPQYMYNAQHSGRYSEWFEMPPAVNIE